MTGELSILQAILDASSDAIFVKGLDNRVILWGQGAEQMYGYTSQEMLGQPVARLLPPERQGESDEILARIRQGEHIADWQTVRQTKKGQLRDVSLNISPIHSASGSIRGACVMARDMTEDHRLAAEARNVAFLLSAAHQVAFDVLANCDGPEALRHIAEAARTLAGAQYAALGVARSDGQGLAEFLAVGMTSEQEAAIGPLPAGKGILGHLLTCTEPLRIAVLANHPASAGFPPGHPPMTSFLGVPIRRGEIVLGSLYLTEKQGGGSFTEADAVAVQAFGAHAAVAIYNQQMQVHQHALVRRLIQAQEEERRAVAYDLHDGLTQFIMASHAHLEVFQRAQSQDNAERAARELEQGLRYLREAVLESRRIINGLRALALDDLGLAGAIEQILQEEKTRAGWSETEFLHNIADLRFETFLEATIFRVVQEALTNVRKHSGSTRVRVALLREEPPGGGKPCLILEVQDWGRGFSTDQPRDTTEHVGLSSMDERAALVGGTCTLQSAPGQGTTIRVMLPNTEPITQGDAINGDGTKNGAAGVVAPAQ